MISSIVLRDPEDLDNLYPFSILHPSFELFSGCLHNFERWTLIAPDTKICFESDHFRLSSFLLRYNLSNPNYQENVLFIDGNVIPDFLLLEEIKEAILKNHHFNINFNFQGKSIAQFVRNTKKARDFINHNINVNRINYIWEVLDLNHNQIKFDIILIQSRFKRLANIINPFFGTHLVGSEIYIGDNVKIMPGVVLDSTDGAIVIDDDVQIMPNSVIIGPSYIGKKTIIKAVAKIYSNCSFGEYCKIGGELEATIFQGYSNKQHEGFLGHSFICEWVNFGADTNNSDLKNTYSNIIMRLPGKRVPTDKMFIGLMAGDHTKTAINSQFTTGTTCGIHCNLFDSGFFPSQIPSYTWGGKGNSRTYNFEQALDTASKMMARRNRSLNEFEIALMKTEYEKVSSA